MVMKYLKTFLMTCSLLLPVLMGFSQKKEITGKITDEATGKPMQGVNIMVSGKKSGVTTKEDGTYTIPVSSFNATLVFSYVGYAQQTVPAAGKKVLDVVMSTAVQSSEEVVVIGYGTQKKSNVTGAVTKYSSEYFDESPVTRLDQALQGKIAGVSVQNVSSEAGADPRIRVRAISSINASADPLIVVDGHPLPDGLSFSNMGDVESIEVLKDAASTAIYGSRGASGVIIVTTKKGKSGKPVFSFKISSGIRSAYKLYDVMSTTEYTNLLFYEASLIAKDPTIPPLSESDIANNGQRGAYVIEQTLMGGVGNNWQSTAIRSAAVTNVLLNVSGGADKFTYYLSGSYQKDQGMMYHSEYERYNLLSKFYVQLSKRLKLDFSINPSYFKRERPSVNFTDFVRYPSYIPVYLNQEQAAFVRQNPLFADVQAGDYAQARYFNGRVYSGYMPDGSLWVNSNEVDAFGTATNSPKSVMETRTLKYNDYRMLSTGTLTWNVLPGLEFKAMGSGYIYFTEGLDFAKRNSNRAGDVNRGQYTRQTYTDLLSENSLTYNKRYKRHTFNLLGAFTVQKTIIQQQSVVGLDYPSDEVTTLNTALFIDQDKSSTYSTINKIGLLSYLSRLTYSFKDRYLLAASYRADGSSYFAPGRKWGNFQSLSLGWIASREQFLRNVKWLSNLKFRGSYGAVGNNRIVNYAFVDQLYAANYPFNLNTGTVNIGQIPSTTIFPNPDITWERTFQYNAGVDVSLFRNRLMFTFDIFKSETDRLLLRQAAMGFSGVPLTWNNIGKLETRGFELQIATVNIDRSNFKWTTTANIFSNRNKVLELGAEAQIVNQGERNEIYMNRVGGPLVQFFGYKTDGIWLSQAEIDAAKAKGLSSPFNNVFVPGGLKLVDVNGDNVINTDDRTIIGNPYPDFSWGIINNIKFSGIDINFSFQGVQGGSLINGDGNYTETRRTNRSYSANRWLSPMYPGDGKTPYGTNGFNWMLTDYVVEDASYFALRDVNIGYTIPAAKLKKLKMNSLRFYFAAQNLYYHFAKGYRGINPEANSNSGPYNTPLVDGYQRGAFPVNKAYMIGAGLTF
jgi:TonB-linked SusC/RagA family outer membrane protein